MNVPYKSKSITSFIKSLIPHDPLFSKYKNETVPISKFYFNYESKNSKCRKYEKYRYWLQDLAVHITKVFALYKIKFDWQELCDIISATRNTEWVVIKNWIIVDYAVEWEIINVEECKIKKLEINGLSEDSKNENFNNYY